MPKDTATEFEHAGRKPGLQSIVALSVPCQTRSDTPKLSKSLETSSLFEDPKGIYFQARLLIDFGAIFDRFWSAKTFILEFKHLHFWN